MIEISGQFSPLLNPFTDDASALSEVRLARYVQRLLSYKVCGFVVNTDLGEFFSTSFSERKAALELVIRESRGQVPVIAHCTTLNTGASLDLAQHAERHGAKAVLLAPPYYGDFTDDELVHHFQIVSHYCKLPILIVDPLNRLNSGCRERISEFPSINFANRARHPHYGDNTPTFEWAYGEAVCCPLAGWVDCQDEVLQESIANHLRGLGIVRCMKELVNSMELEVGAVRSPYLEPSQAQKEVLRALGGMILAKKSAAGSCPAA
ncbi:MAG: dihydrodipicolinate synthase family protein [Chthonomonas sp.]|nr:dihydrodipicolinate synthase family protein [Chthonomonas sp.]